MSAPSFVGEPEPTEETRELLALMATGATDRAIARVLGVSERTVLRRVNRLHGLFGTRSRFQLGLLVNLRQWAQPHGHAIASSE